MDDRKVFPTEKKLASLEEYEMIMELRPPKFDQTSSSYHLAIGDEYRCDECIHFFQRHIDGLFLCEIVRPVPEEPIQPEWTCQFYTAEGAKFPLFKGEKE